MKNLTKIFFVLFIVRPIILFVLGLNVIGREKLPKNGPAVVLANHNSHLDTMVLLSLFPVNKLKIVRPVAAADYFLKNKFMTWLSTHCIGIIALDRSGKTPKEELFNDCYQALDNNEILIIFPEGSRGDPEKMGTLKKGVYHMLKDREHIPIIPVVMHGLGRVLPRGEALLVPFNCDVVIGDPLEKQKDATSFIAELTKTFEKLFSYCLTKTTLDDNS